MKDEEYFQTSEDYAKEVLDRLRHQYGVFPMGGHKEWDFPNSYDGDVFKMVVRLCNKVLDESKREVTNVDVSEMTPSEADKKLKEVLTQRLREVK